MNLQKIKQILEDTKSGVIHHPEVYEEAVKYLREEESKPALFAYIFEVDGDRCIVLGESISDAMDKLEEDETILDYELCQANSLDVFY